MALQCYDITIVFVGRLIKTTYNQPILFHGVRMKPTFRQRFQYQFDNLMSRGTPAMIGMLFVFSLIIVIIAGAVISATGFVQEAGSERLGFGEAAWESLMRTLDSGT